MNIIAEWEVRGSTHVAACVYKCDKCTSTIPVVWQCNEDASAGRPTGYYTKHNVHPYAPRNIQKESNSLQGDAAMPLRVLPSRKEIVSGMPTFYNSCSDLSFLLQVLGISVHNITAQALIPMQQSSSEHSFFTT